MNFKLSRKHVLGQLFRKYVFDLHGNKPKSFIGSDGRSYVPVVLPYDFLLSSNRR